MSSRFPEVPTLIRGVLYPSQGAAARALGLHYTTIQRAMDQGRLETVGLNPRGRAMAKPVTINNVRYSSFYKAAAAIGVSHIVVARRVKKLGTNLTYTPGVCWGKAKEN